MTSSSNSAYSDFVGKKLEVIGIEVEVHVVPPENVSETTRTSTFTIDRPAGACNVTETVKGTKESEECSGRGMCDRGSGMCSCFAGYSGAACAKQDNLVIE